MNLKTLGDFKKDGKRWVIQIRMRTRRKRQLPIQEGKAAAWQSSIQMLQASCQKLKKTQSKTQNILEHPNNSLKIQKAKIKVKSTGKAVSAFRSHIQASNKLTFSNIMVKLDRLQRFRKERMGDETT